jgi:hypothetical protein
MMMASRTLRLGALRAAPRRVAQWTVVLALASGLGGCLTSQRPLFAPDSAVAAFGDGGRYVAYQRIGARYKRDESVQLRNVGNGYDYVNEKGAVTPVTLHPLGGRLFAIQARDENGGYDYARLRVRGVEAFVEIADCDKQNAKVLAKLGIVVRESALAIALTGHDHVKEHDCILDGVSNASNAFGTLHFGAPTGKLVRD